MGVAGVDDRVPVLEARDVRFRYAPNLPWAVDGVNLQVFPGEVLGILGENGAGKSTLALVLAGIIPRLLGGEFQGRVMVDGRDMQEFSAGELAGLVGLVLQNPFNQMTGLAATVFDEVAFGPQNLGWPRQVILSEVEAVLDRLGIAHLRNRNPLSLSGGEQQRVAIASVLVMKPRLLILDEPTSQLDPAGTESIFALIGLLRKQGYTTVLIEHKVEAVAEVCDRVLLLRQGRVVLEGTPAEVLGDARVVEAGVRRLLYSELADTVRSFGYAWAAGRMTSYRDTVAVLRELTERG